MEKENKKLSLTECKALAYDTLANIEQLQLQLRSLNNEIARLQKEEQ